MQNPYEMDILYSHLNEIKKINTNYEYKLNDKKDFKNNNKRKNKTFDFIIKKNKRV